MSGKVVPLPVSATKLASARLRRARLAAGISQEEAARRIGVSARSYGAWERGDVGLQALEALCVLEAAASADKGKVAA